MAVLWARGACDEKGSTPGMVYGIALGKRLGLIDPDQFTMYYFGNMEEWCDGIAPHSFVEADPKVKPDFVVIGEPTKMQVYRGHKGRLELKDHGQGQERTRGGQPTGRQRHLQDAAHHRRHQQDGAGQLGDHEFLGHGKITVSDMEVSTPSINAVPDECTIYIDRRMTFGESKADVHRQLAAHCSARTQGKRHDRRTILR
jgi:acetylornithine deacetylase/succinyl-diaminopimelate desuccinylase-like protein